MSSKSETTQIGEAMTERDQPPVHDPTVIKRPRGGMAGGRHGTGARVKEKRPVHHRSRWPFYSAAASTYRRRQRSRIGAGRRHVLDRPGTPGAHGLRDGASPALSPSSWLTRLAPARRPPVPRCRGAPWMSAIPALGGDGSRGEVELRYGRSRKAASGSAPDPVSRNGRVQRHEERRRPGQSSAGCSSNS